MNRPHFSSHSSLVSNRLANFPAAARMTVTFIQNYYQVKDSYVVAKFIHYCNVLLRDGNRREWTNAYLAECMGRSPRQVSRDIGLFRRAGLLVAMYSLDPLSVPRIKNDRKLFVRTMRRIRPIFVSEIKRMRSPNRAEWRNTFMEINRVYKTSSKIWPIKMQRVQDGTWHIFDAISGEDLGDESEMTWKLFDGTIPLPDGSEYRMAECFDWR